jgi:hypothetical protein
MCDVNIILEFWSGTNYQTLLHELSRDQPKTMKELLNIATRHASGEEAIEAFLVQGDMKAAPIGSQGAPFKAVGKGATRTTKSNKRGPKRQPQ